MSPATIFPVDEKARRAAVVERIGALGEKLRFEAARLKPLVEERGKLLVEVAGWYEDFDPDRSDAWETESFLLKVGPRENERTITDRAKCYKLLRMTIAQFIEVCTIPLKLVDKRIAKEKHSLFLVQERTGPRDIEVMRKPQPPPVAA